MRNPFVRLAKSDAPKLTLRQRAAALNASAARVIGRTSLDAEADQGRRSIVKGSLVAAAIPLPVLASQAMAATPLAPDLPHPDQALLDAEAEVSRAHVAMKAAEKASGESYRLLWDALGHCPADLVVKPWERMTFERASKPWIKHYPRWAWIDRYEGDDGKPDPMVKVWTADSLRATIRNAVLLFGKGGQTPHMIRAWRNLLPVAEAFESRKAELNARFRYDELQTARKATSDAYYAANSAFVDMPAKTLDGLAVKARQLEGCGWHRMPSNWVSLLQSAAAVSGVILSAPEVDVPAWIKGWEDFGGSIKRDHVSREIMFCVPPKPADAGPSFMMGVDRLTKELGANETEIKRWLSSRV